MKTAFNARMDDLRRLKERVKDNLRADEGRIAAITAQLQTADGGDMPTLPSLHSLVARVLTSPQADEWPERRDAFTDEELHRFIARRKAEEASSKRGAMADADEPDLPASPPVSLPQTRATTAKEEESKQQLTVASVPASPAGPVFDSLDRVRASLHRRRLRSSLLSLVERLHAALRSFNAALAAEAAAKLRLDDDLLNAELRLLTYCDELGVLKEFEEKERSLEEKGRRMREGKAALIAEMADVERGLHGRMKELQAGVDKEKALMAEFAAAVGGEKNEFYSILLKVYKRKVKRKKAKGGAGAGAKAGKGEKKSDEAPREDKAGDDDDEDDSDDDDSDAESVSSATSSLHSDSDEDDEEVCPPHCPPIAYERTLELREKRLDCEDSQESLQRLCAEAAKVYERLQAKVKGVEKEEKSSEREMQTFQQDKQRTLNTIEVFLPLQLSQFLHFTQGGPPHAPRFMLPPSLGDSLLFTRANAERLQSRTGELELERAAIDAEFAALKRSGSVVQKEMEGWEARIEEEKKRCESVQRLKFGRLVDLSFILDDDGGRHRAEEEKRRQLAEMEAANRGVIGKWEEDMGGAKRGYAEQLQLNTRLLERVAELTQAQYALEGKLNAQALVEQVGLGGEGEGAEDRKEKDELVQLVELQEREIEALKAEMGVLRRKGGHVYTAV